MRASDQEARRADVPAELDALVADLLAKDPARRPATAAQVRARLVAVAFRRTECRIGTSPTPGW